MSSSERKDFTRDKIILNPIIGKTPGIGPIPAAQLLPWSLIVVLSYIATNFFVSLGVIPWFAVSVWGVATWWFLTGDNPASFINLWRYPPGKDWVETQFYWKSPLSNPVEFKESLKKVNPVRVPNQIGGKDNFMPFANELDLVSLGRVELEDTVVPFYLLKGSGRWRCVFPFRLEGIHSNLASEEIGLLIEEIREGIKEFPQDEKATFILGSYTDSEYRCVELERKATLASIPLIKVLTLNEAKNTTELSENGKRQIWDHLVFCTFTVSTEGGKKADDVIGNIINSMQKRLDKIFQRVTGSEEESWRLFFTNLFYNAYHDGYVRWQLLLNQRLNLTATPLSENELWRWTFRRLNALEVPLPEIPQTLVLSNSDGDLTLTEEINLEENILTVLTAGQHGESSVPRHGGSSDKVYVRGQVCGLLSMEQKPKGWSSTVHQASWFWNILNASYVHDTEVVVDVGRANQGIIEGNLTRQAKQSVVKEKRAKERGFQGDVSATITQEETVEAQRRLVKGNQVYVTAPVFLIYRNDPARLRKACQLLANSFGSAKVKREKSVSWALWIESLPFTLKWIRNSTSPLGESRLYFDSDEVPGILPLMKPRNLDKAGVELITEGGKPLRIDLFENQTERALITGKSGSGKSLLAYRFVVEALSQGVPVIGMDVSIGESTFKTATDLLGDYGAYYNVLKTSSNLMELPDVRSENGFDEIARAERIKTWKSFVLKALIAIVMGNVDDPALLQRCEGILKKVLNLFLNDPRIIDRYNLAFQGGWKSEQWQNIPTLRDFLKFCSQGLLNLSEDDLDKRALNQIKFQINQLLESELGDAIGLPSSFSPDPMMKFFALGGITGEYNSGVMSMAAYVAAMRTALSAKRSLFVGDELSILFKRSGFSELVGELAAVGRKQGIAMVLLSQDPDAICNSVAGEQIVQNLGYRITGAITPSASDSFVKYLKYNEDSIRKNATETYLPNRSDLVSYWLVEKAGIFWDTRYYPSPMLLATVANSRDEMEARDRVLSQYGSSNLEQLRALRDFADQYVAVVKQGLGTKGFMQINRRNHQK